MTESEMTKDPIQPPKVQDPAQRVQSLFEKYVVPSYSRFPLVFTHGTGPYLWDTNGRRYLDLGSGIAVNSLGHAHPRIVEVLHQQAEQVIHISNLYYHESQGRLAQALCQRIGPGKVFFCNSGAEANEALFKLARKYGSEEGRFEILTTLNSFHGRTLAGIAATGQSKVKKGFEPLPQGFRHVPFNDLNAIEEALSPATVAVLIEGIQGEGGIHVADPDYLIGLRKLCDKHGLLLLMDEVQCGQYRTGRFHSYQRILEDEEVAFLPDGVAMAKGLGGGIPIGAVWIREPYADLLGPGSHGSTFGGNPLACTVALEVLKVIEEENLAENVRALGAEARKRLIQLSRKFSNVILDVRGLGFMIGIELAPAAQIPGFARQPDRPASLQLVERLHQAGVLTIPAGKQVVRLLPPLNLTKPQLEEGLIAIESVVGQIAK